MRCRRLRRHDSRFGEVLRGHRRAARRLRLGRHRPWPGRLGLEDAPGPSTSKMRAVPATASGHTGVGVAEAVLLAGQQDGAQAAQAPRGGDGAGERVRPPGAAHSRAGRASLVALSPPAGRTAHGHEARRAALPHGTPAQPPVHTGSFARPCRGILRALCLVATVALIGNYAFIMSSPRRLWPAQTV
jgi:hypothetical protein